MAMKISTDPKPVFQKWVADGKPCAFCNTRKPDSQAIGGPDGLKICRDCVSLCNDIIRDRDNQARATAIAALDGIEKEMPDSYQPHELILALYAAIAEGKIPGVRVE